MDFFNQEAHAQKQTRRLILLFALAVIVVVFLVYVILATLIEPLLKPETHISSVYSFINDFLVTVLTQIGGAFSRPLQFLKWIWDLRLFCWIAAGTFLSIALGCIYKFRLLSGGGSSVAELLGGRKIEDNSADPDEKRLHDVIEEMAVASGMPAPEIYVLDNERGINSFAAGHTHENMAIGVTRGCLKLLTRDELQGVIAHEFSHILNGDTRLNLKLMALAHGLFWPTILGRALIYGSAGAPPAYTSFLIEEDQTQMLPTAPIGFIFVMIGSISLPFVRLIKSAICREREWLADAAAVQFTRNPAGIESAFKKIGGLSKHGRLDTPYAETASHLYFVNSAYDSWFSFQSTHPPLEKRILAVDPAFDGKFPKVNLLPPNQYERDQAYEQLVARAVSIGTDKEIAAQNDDLTANRIRLAALMRLNLPSELAQALQEPASATSLVYALLLGADDSIPAKQLQILSARVSPEILENIRSLAAQIQILGDDYKFSLAEFAALMLPRLEADDCAAFVQTIQQLIESDGAVELFEYALMKMVVRRINSFANGLVSKEIHYGRVADVLPECALLLSALAHLEDDDESKAREAFAKGREFLDAPTGQVQFLTRSEWDLAKIDAALNRLAKNPPAVKRNILMACGRTAAADGRVTARAAELLHAIADSLDCTMPPFVDAIRMEELAKGT